jgi:hypothetical protein
MIGPVPKEILCTRLTIPAFARLNVGAVKYPRLSYRCYDQGGHEERGFSDASRHGTRRSSGTARAPCRI